MEPLGLFSAVFFAALLSVGAICATRNILWRPLARALLPFLAVWFCLVFPGLLAARAWSYLSGSGLRGLVPLFGLATLLLAVGCMSRMEWHLLRSGRKPRVIYVAVLASVALMIPGLLTPAADGDLSRFEMILGTLSALLVSGMGLGWRPRPDQHRRADQSNA